MIGRHRALLQLLSNEGGQTTKLRLVKLAFLLTKKATQAPKASLYEFFPYHHGPFSFTLYHELRSLERDGWLRVCDYEVAIARNVRAEVERLESGLRSDINRVSE